MLDIELSCVKVREQPSHCKAIGRETWSQLHRVSALALSKYKAIEYCGAGYASYQFSTYRVASFGCYNQ